MISSLLRKPRLALLAALLAVGVPLAASRSIATSAAPPAVGAPPAGLPGLERIARLSQDLYVGSTPEGTEGFHSLQRLGIRTILSVDGARPNAAAARAVGIRTVHLPIGYQGCPTPQAHAIVRAVRDLPKPIYMHCHHGRHRAPGAAAFVRVALDRLTPEEAAREMERLGTGKEYAGLYATVRGYRPPTTAELDALPAEWPEAAPTPPLVSMMVDAEGRFDRLLKAQREGWSAPAAGKEDGPAHQALLLRELFAEWNRNTAKEPQPTELRRWMREAEADAGKLERALLDGKKDDATRVMDRVAAGCVSCHSRYRNMSRP